MPYAVLEKEIERLDETQQNTVVLFTLKPQTSNERNENHKTVKRL